MSENRPPPAPSDTELATPAGPTPPPSPHECETLSGAVVPAPAEPTLPPELVNHPRYRILRLLGVGGMGTVYQAEHRVMERCVALKVIRTDLTSNAGAVERFRREVKAAAKLNHPNIVDAFDAEQVGNLHLLVMEYVEGSDLARVVAERGPLPVAEACNYVSQAALGLQHAFERGMIHRDIKPQNLMLTGGTDTPLEYRTVKILDFGLARFATKASSGDTASGTLLGTVDFMAPEQADDARHADIRADIYSLGCTLYYLLAGRAPFPEGSLVQKVMCHVERTPTPLTNFRSDLPPGLLDVLDKLMAKRPEDRCQTPAEVVQALAPFHPGHFLTGSHTAIPVFPVAKAVPKAVLVKEPPSTVEWPHDAPAPEESSTWVQPQSDEVPVSRFRRARRRLSAARTALFGCFGLAALTIVVCGGLAYLTISKLSQVSDMLDRLKDQGGGWDHLERVWLPPPADSPRELLFPPRMDEYQLQEVDDQADRPALDIRQKGQHGHYQANEHRLDLYVYRLNELEKEAQYLHVINALEKQRGKGDTRRSLVAGSPLSSRLTYHLGDRAKGNATPRPRGVLWWNRGWLFMLQTEEAVDPEPLLLKYLERFKPEA
jgi:serine/threonine protein kinase